LKLEGTSAAFLQGLGGLKLAGITLGLAALLSVCGVLLGRKAADREAALVAVTASGATQKSESPSRESAGEQAANSSGRGAAGTKAAPFVPVPMSAEEFRAVRDRRRAWGVKVDHDVTLIDNRIRVRLRFHSLYAALALSPNQIERFETLASEKHLTFSGLIGTPADSAAFRLGNVPRTDAVVGKALGEEYIPAFQAFVATSDLRLIADDLAANTYYTDNPLTSVQADLLVQTCVDNCRPDAARAFIDPDTVNWDAVLTRAESFLAPAQLRALRGALAKRTFDLEFKQVTGLPLRVPVRGL
jgi:hypothetical protein